MVNILTGKSSFLQGNISPHCLYINETFSKSTIILYFEEKGESRKAKSLHKKTIYDLYTILFAPCRQYTEAAGRKRAAISSLLNNLTLLYNVFSNNVSVVSPGVLC